MPWGMPGLRNVPQRGCHDMARSPEFDYWTVRIRKGSWLHGRILAEAEAKNSTGRIPAMLRAKIEGTYDQTQEKVDPESLTDKVVSAVRERLDKMVLSALPIVRDEHVDTPQASKDDLDRMLPTNCATRSTGSQALDFWNQMVRKSVYFC